MKRGFVFTLITIVAFMSSSCFLATSSTTVSGYVHDDKKPVAGAEVSLNDAKTTTGPDGKFTITASHRASQMLYLKVKKAGLAQSKEISFPGFAAPDKEIDVEMLEVVSY